MAQWLTVTPAYGRDYTTAEAVLEHWLDAKDFIIRDVSSRWNGSYVNKDDAPKDTVIKVRYARLANFCLLKFDGEWKMVGVSDGSEIEQVEDE